MKCSIDSDSVDNAQQSANAMLIENTENQPQMAKQGQYL